VSGTPRPQERRSRTSLGDGAEVLGWPLYSIFLYLLYGIPLTSGAWIHRHVLMTRSRRRVGNSNGMRVVSVPQPRPATIAADAWLPHRKVVADASPARRHQGAMAAASALATADASRCAMGRGVSGAPCTASDGGWLPGHEQPHALTNDILLLPRRYSAMQRIEPT